jgi:hypothetical protein
MCVILLTDKTNGPKCIKNTKVVLRPFIVSQETPNLKALSKFKSKVIG